MKTRTMPAALDTGVALTMPTLAVPLAQTAVGMLAIGHGVGAQDRQLADASRPPAAPRRPRADIVVTD